MNDQLNKAGIDALLQKSSLPSNVKMRISGSYQTEEAAQHVLRNVTFFLRVFGAYLNLAGVESVSIADDHNAALAAIHKGDGVLALAPSNDEFGTGFAVTAPVLRDGVLKSSIVFSSRLIQVLNDPLHEKRRHAIHVLAHESAHAHDLEVLRQSFPDSGKQCNLDWKAQCLSQLANVCWSEYIASHLSSRWGTDDYCAEFEHQLCKTLANAMEKGSACIHDFRFHRNGRKTEAEIRNIFGRLLTRAAYLIGHIHGRGKTVAEMAPRYYRSVQETPWFKPVFERYEANLKDMHATYGSWTSLDVFQPLLDTCEALMNAAGLQYIQLADGSYSIALRQQQIIRESSTS